MPGKHPLIETLKVCILQLQEEGPVTDSSPGPVTDSSPGPVTDSSPGPVTDSSPRLVSCCELLERILRKGLQNPLLRWTHRDYWHCFEQLPQQDTCGRLGTVSLAVQQTTACPKLLSAQGRGRFFIRLMLNRRILGNVVKHLLHSSRIMEWYNPDISVLRNEEFVVQAQHRELQLPGRELVAAGKPAAIIIIIITAIWWDMHVKRMLIACLCFRYLDGRVFVLELLHGKMAQADRFAEPGDIIDEINGISLRNSANGQAGEVLSRLRGRPLRLRLLRWRGKDGSVYRPLVTLLQRLQQENPSLQFSPSPAQPQAHPTSQRQSQCVKDGRILYSVRLLGKTNAGMYGGKEVLQRVIPTVLQKSLATQEVLLDVKETHLTCTDKFNKQELFYHHFPEISCVGRFGQPDFTIFAFCVVDPLDTGQPPGFCCVVLQAESSSQCEEIVHRIAAGFKNTEWFV
ncbi:uncharacterized protein LOC143510238 isoform X2 [Brachyhypopomus gauderio]|uniref:uncharacterized protein LOC143510238 isoform X2 n=1 Tax=Brachyhypopomus gauderio TaxID=698409 RepID=UPI0040435521